MGTFPPPALRTRRADFRHRALQWNHAARTRACRLRPAGGSCEPSHPAHTLALAGRCVVRPVDALTTATARVVPFACACDDVWHSCSFVGVIGRSATPGACSRSPSLPPEAPSLGRHCPASTVIRASPPPWPARPCPHGSSVGACHATGRASRVASIPFFHTCRRHYPGGTGRCSRRSLPDRWQPSPIFGRVGFRIARFEACSAFIRIAARVVAEPPKAALCRRSASADVVTSIVRSDCYRLERQLPGGIRTRWGMAPFTAHQIDGLFSGVGVRSGGSQPRRRSESRPATGHRAHKVLVAVGVQTEIRELRTAPEEAGSKSPERTRDKANEMAQIGSIGLSGRVSSGVATGPLTRSSDGWRVDPGLSCASAPRFLAGDAVNNVERRAIPANHHSVRFSVAIDGKFTVATTRLGSILECAGPNYSSQLGGLS